MYRFLPIFVGCLLGIASLPVGGAERVVPEGALSVEALVTRALDAHPLIHAADAEIEEAQAVEARASRARIPRVQIKTRFTGLPKMEGGPLDGYAHPTLFGPFIHARAELGMPLYVSGQLAALREAAEAGVDVSRARKEVVASEVVYQVTRAYLGVVSAESLERSFASVLADLKQLESAEEKRETDGSRGSKVRALVVSVLIGEAEKRQISAIQARSTALAGLRSAIGLEFDAELEVNTQALKAREGELLPLDTCLDMARKRRPELMAAYAGLEAVDADVKFRQRVFGPGIGLVGYYTFAFAPMATDQTGVFRKDPYNTNSEGAALGLRWDGRPGVMWGELQGAFARKERVQSLISFLRSQVERDVRTAHEGVRLARDVVVAQDRSMASSRKWYRSSEKTFKAGKSTPSRFRDAVLQYLNRIEKAVFAIEEHELALSRLRQWVSAPILQNPSP